MYYRPRKIGGISSRDLGYNSMSAMSTSPNFIWGSLTVRMANAFHVYHFDIINDSLFSAKH